MQNSSLSDYYEALERIKNGIPIRVRKGVRITKDSVAIEAGRKNGSIKKSRENFSDLIQAINVAAEEQTRNMGKTDVEKLKQARLKAEQYRTELEAALAREISLLYELYEVKKQLAKLTGSNIIPLRKEF